MRQQEVFLVSPCCASFLADVFVWQIEVRYVGVLICIYFVYLLPSSHTVFIKPCLPPQTVCVKKKYIAGTA